MALKTSFRFVRPEKRNTTEELFLKGNGYMSKWDVLVLIYAFSSRNFGKAVKIWVAGYLFILFIMFIIALDAAICGVIASFCPDLT